jgi:hypothetical protein
LSDLVHRRITDNTVLASTVPVAEARALLLRGLAPAARLVAADTARITLPGHLTILWHDDLRDATVVETGIGAPVPAWLVDGVVAQAHPETLAALLDGGDGLALPATIVRRVTAGDVARIVVPAAQTGGPEIDVLRWWLAIDRPVSRLVASDSDPHRGPGAAPLDERTVMLRDRYPYLTTDQVRQLLAAYLGGMRLVSTVPADAIETVLSGSGPVAALLGPAGPDVAPEPGRLTIVWSNEVRAGAVVSAESGQLVPSGDVDGLVAALDDAMFLALLRAAIGEVGPEPPTEPWLPAVINEPAGVAGIQKVILRHSDVDAVAPDTPVQVQALTSGAPSVAVVYVDAAGTPIRDGRPIDGDSNVLTPHQVVALVRARRYARRAEPGPDSWFAAVIAAALDVDAPTPAIAELAAMTVTQLRRHLAMKIDRDEGSPPGCGGQRRAPSPITGSEPSC